MPLVEIYAEAERIEALSKKRYSIESALQHRVAETIGLRAGLFASKVAVRWVPVVRGSGSTQVSIEIHYSSGGEIDPSEEDILEMVESIYIFLKMAAVLGKEVDIDIWAIPHLGAKYFRPEKN